jgi:penicillin-binding protein 1A
MKAAHQNLQPQDLPGPPPGDLLSNLFSVGRPNAQAANAPQSITPQGVPQAGYIPSQAAPTPRPVRTAVRPEAASGLDGWLVDRLFGR